MDKSIFISTLHISAIPSRRVIEPRMLKRSANGFHNQFTCLRSTMKVLLRCYTTSVASKDASKTAPMVQFLVQSVGFSEQDATALVTKSRSPFSPPKAKSVVDFLKKSGFDASQISSLIAASPNVLRNNVDKTLEPKIRAFQDLGFSGSNLGLVVSRHSWVLMRGLKSHILPTLGMLNPLIGSREQLIKVMLQLKSGEIFSPRLLKNFPANVLLLQRYGVTTARIKWLMLQGGIVFASTQQLEKIVKAVEEKLGIPPTSAMFVYGIFALTKKSPEKIESWRHIFHTYGWSEAHISNLFRSHPLILTLSEKNLRIKLKYFMEELGYEPDYLAARGTLLSFSLEKRILPRIAVMRTLKDRHMLKHSADVYYGIALTELEFRKKYVVPYKQELPQLYELYTKAVSCSLSEA